MIVLDTSLLVGAFSSGGRSYAFLRQLAKSGTHLAVPSLVLYEWWRGPRLAAEMAEITDFIAPEAILPFGREEAQLAANLYISAGRARARQFDIAIAATAIVQNAPLWTLNPRDFADIPGLQLYRGLP